MTRTPEYEQPLLFLNFDKRNARNFATENGKKTAGPPIGKALSE